jgi:hypothetical protein
LLSGVLGAEYVCGVQSEGVIVICQVYRLGGAANKICIPARAPATRYVGCGRVGS